MGEYKFSGKVEEEQPKRRRARPAEEKGGIVLPEPNERRGGREKGGELVRVG